MTHRHRDRVWDFEELPEKVQKEHDWASSGDQFARFVWQNGDAEFVPLENFIAVLPNQQPEGKDPRDGFASDSFFTGFAIRFLTREDDPGQNEDYVLWRG